MVAKNGSVRLTATNLEMAISCLIRGKVEEEGDLTVPSKLFSDYVSLLPNEKVNIRIEGQMMLVSCGSYKTKMNGLPAADFPLVPSITATRSYQIPAEKFRHTLSQVLFAVAANESRPELAGVFMKFHTSSPEKGIVTLATTDSYRLTECQIGVNSSSSEEISVIVPAKTMAEVGRILSIFRDDVETPSDLTVNLSENQIVFVFGTVELISRTIDGTYPDYRQIIPKTFQTEAKIDREDFIKIVKAASLFSKSGLFDVNVEFQPGGSVTVSAVDAARGENTASCSAKEISGQVNAVTLNYRYLLDGLQALNTDDISFQMIDAANPCVLKPVSSSNEYLYILMPIRQ